MSAFRKFDPAAAFHSRDMGPAKVAKAAKAQSFRRFQPPKAYLKLAKAPGTLGDFSQGLAVQDPQNSSTLAALATLAAPSRHVTLMAVPPGVPLEWAEGVVKLLTMPAPAPFSDDRWQALQDDAHNFLRTWGAQAHGFDWTNLDTFAIHRHAPQARLDAMGLVPLLDGCQVVALTEDGAVLVTRSGARQTFRRHQAIVVAELCMIWDLGGDGPETLGDVA